MDTATLSEISGGVLARQPLDTTFATATDGYELQARGQIQTLDDGRVRLDTSEGTIVRLGPLSFFTYEGTEEEPTGLLVRLRITLGEIWVILGGGSAEVDTPSGLATVRGSYLSVSVNPDTGEVFVTCLEGSCSLGNDAGSVELVAGQTAVITNANLPPSIGTMSEEDIQHWLDFNPEATLVVTPLADTEEATEPTEDGPPTSTPTTEVSAPEPPTLTLTHDVVCKSGPGSSYDDIRTLYAGTSAFVVGQYPGYWVIEVPGQPGLTCWVPTSVADANAAAGDVGQLAAPPKPTNTPKPTRDVPKDDSPSNAPTVFENIYGFTGTIYDSETCQNAFLVQVSDADGIDAVQIAFSINDPAFSAPTYHSLMYAEGYWGGTFAVDAAYADTIYWRIRVIDGKENTAVSATFTYQDMYGACGGG